MEDPISKFNYQVFAAQLRTAFKIHADGMEPQMVELIAAEERPTPPGVELFVLVFRGPATPRLQQKIYRFEHEKMGAFDLFMTAIAGDGQSTSYEVVFHRLKKKQS